MSSTVADVLSKKPSRSIIKTGIHFFDEVFNGLTLGTLNLVSGRPGIGKTSFQLRLAKHLHQENNMDIYWLSFNESHMNIAKRYYNFHRSKNQFDEHIAQDDFQGLEHFKLEQPIPFKKISNRINEIAINGRPFCFFIENPSEMDVPFDIHKSQSIFTVLKDIQEVIKGFQGLVFIALNCSLEVEQRGGTKRPMLSDVPYFDFIYTLIDKTFTVWRPEFYGFEQDEEGLPCQDLLYLTCLYNKSGPCAEIRTPHRGVNEKVDTSLIVAQEGLLKLKFQDDFISISEEGGEYKVVVTSAAGEITLDEYCSTKKNAWDMLLIHYEIEHSDDWLEIEIRSVADTWVRFLLRQVLAVLESGESKTPKIKQHLNYWLNHLAY
jgi:replicative DNA helicase